MEKNKQIFIALGAAFFVVVAASLFLRGKPSIPTANKITPTQAAGTHSYTLSVVAQHSTKTDCWMAISGKVYNVTPYVPNHNSDIVQGCGTEATTLFEGVGKHAGRATSLLDEYLIGTLQN